MNKRDINGTEGVFHEGEVAFGDGIPMIDNPYLRYSDCCAVNARASIIEFSV